MALDLTPSSFRTTPLGRWQPEAYALFRFVAGLLFSFHGAQKLFGAFGGERVAGGLPLAAGIIELVGGALIAIGLAGGLAAFLASGEMAVAYFKAHFSLEAFWPIENRGELAALYCFAFLYVAARGSGAYSVDALLRRDHPVERPASPRDFELPHAARARTTH
jgi:putative oxidoreductase